MTSKSAWAADILLKAELIRKEVESRYLQKRRALLSPDQARINTVQSEDLPAGNNKTSAKNLIDSGQEAELLKAVEGDLHQINAVDVLQRAKRSTRAAEVVLGSPNFNNTVMNSGEIDLSDDSLRELDRSPTKTPQAQGPAVLEYAREQQAKAATLISPPTTRDDLANGKEERWSIKLSEQLRSDAEGQLRKVDQLLKYSPMKVKNAGAGENQQHPGVDPRAESRHGVMMMMGERERSADEDWSRYLGGSALLVEDLAPTRPSGREDATSSRGNDHMSIMDARIRASQPTWSSVRPNQEEVDTLEPDENHATAHKRKPPRLRIWSPVHGNQRASEDLDARTDSKAHAYAKPPSNAAHEHTIAGRAPNIAENNHRNFGMSSARVQGNNTRDISTRASSGYGHGGLASVLRYQQEEDESEEADTKPATHSAQKNMSSQHLLAQSSDYGTLASVIRYHDDASHLGDAGINNLVHHDRDCRDAPEAFDYARAGDMYKEQGAGAGAGARRVRGYAERLALLDKEIQEKEREAEILQDEVRDWLSCDAFVWRAV
jgi:hypothetical protein